MSTPDSEGTAGDPYDETLTPTTLVPRYRFRSPKDLILVACILTILTSFYFHPVEIFVLLVVNFVALYAIPRYIAHRILRVPPGVPRD